MASKLSAAICFCKKLPHQHRNARVLIQQIKAGKWKFHGKYSIGKFKCTHATRKGRVLRFSSAAHKCCFDDANKKLGLFSRWVWHCAAKEEAKRLELTKHDQIRGKNNVTQNQYF